MLYDVCQRLKHEDQREKYSPRTEHELSSELGNLSAALPNRHSDLQSVADYHRNPTDKTVSDIVALLVVGPWVSSTASHSERIVYPEVRIGVKCEWCAENIYMGNLVTMNE